MNDLQFIFLIILLGGVLPLLIVGALISFKGKRHWINGVDQSKLKDPVAFGQYVGNSIIVTGMLVLLVDILLYLGIIGYLVFALALTFVSIIPLPCLYIAKNKYQ